MMQKAGMWQRTLNFFSHRPDGQNTHRREDVTNHITLYAVNGEKRKT